MSLCVQHTNQQVIYHLKVCVYNSYNSNNYAVILCDKSSFYNIIFLVNNSLVILGFMRAGLWGLIQVEWPVFISPLSGPHGQGQAAHKNIGHVSNFDWNILMRWWWRWWWQKMRYVVNKYSTLDNLVYIHIHILNLVCGTYFYE